MTQKASSHGNNFNSISEHLCRPILLNNPDLVILQDLQENFIFISPQCKEITGFDPDQLLEKGFISRIHKNDLPEVKKQWDESIKEKKTNVFDYRFYDSEGEIIWLNHRFSILDLGNGKVFIQNNIHDITIQKQFEETLLEVDKRLTENNIIMKNKNIALEELLSQVETQKSRLGDRIQTNIFTLVTPLLNELLNRATNADKKILELILTNLDSVASQFGSKISDKMYSLSSREIEICNMIKEGLSSKDISQILNIELVTVITHRNNIRKKLGIRNSSTNLMTYLKNI